MGSAPLYRFCRSHHFLFRYFNIFPKSTTSWWKPYQRFFCDLFLVLIFFPVYRRLSVLSSLLRTIHPEWPVWLTVPPSRYLILCMVIVILLSRFFSLSTFFPHVAGERMVLPAFVKSISNIKFVKNVYPFFQILQRDLILTPLLRVSYPRVMET